MDIGVILKRFDAPDDVRQMTLGRFEVVRIGPMTIGPRRAPTIATPADTWLGRVLTVALGERRQDAEGLLDRVKSTSAAVPEEVDELIREMLRLRVPRP